MNAYQRATAGYDDAHEEALLETITLTVFSAWIIGDHWARSKRKLSSAAQWVSVPSHLSRRTHRLDRSISTSIALCVLCAMARYFISNTTATEPCWRLSNGLEVSDEVARIFITKLDVASVDGTMFSGFLAQTRH